MARIQYDKIIVKDFSYTNSKIQRIHNVLQNTIAPGLTYNHFYKDYIDCSGSKTLSTVLINTTCVKNRNGFIGIYFAIFYSDNSSGILKHKARTIVGFIPSMRGKRLYSNWIVQKKYISFKSRNLGIPLYAVITAVNPHIFSSTIEGLKKYSPVPNPMEISHVENYKSQADLVRDSNSYLNNILANPASTPDWLVKVNFIVNITPADRAKFMQSNNPLKRWYIWKNARYPDWGVLIDFDVSMENVIGKLKTKFFSRK